MVVSAESYVRPRPATQAEQLESAAAHHQKQIDDLRNLAEKRFWTLFFDNQFLWWGVKDAVGVIVHPPRPLSELRGFFAGLPPQA